MTNGFDRTEEKQARSFHVTGNVQGVGYRQWTAARASELSLSGFVRNLPDGAVEVVAFGTGPALDQLTHDLAVGPAAGSVHSVFRGPDPDLFPQPVSFTIRYT